VRQYRELLDDFASKIKEAAGEDTDGGRAITQVSLALCPIPARKKRPARDRALTTREKA